MTGLVAADDLDLGDLSILERGRYADVGEHAQRAGDVATVLGSGARGRRTACLGKGGGACAFDGVGGYRGARIAVDFDGVGLDDACRDVLQREVADARGLLRSLGGDRKDARLVDLDGHGDVAALSARRGRIDSGRVRGAWGGCGRLFGDGGAHADQRGACRDACARRGRALHEASPADVLEHGGSPFELSPCAPIGSGDPSARAR